MYGPKFSVKRKIGNPVTMPVVIICLLLGFGLMKAQEQQPFFETSLTAPYETHDLRLKSNILPWAIGVPNIGAEYTLGKKWSVALDVLYCPWKISDKFSVKTVSVLPEVRWWIKNTGKGSFFNLHANVAWYNVRFGHYRYQDPHRPLLGGGIGYGYCLNLNKRWGFEFEIGAGVANMKYNRYYNVKNGALKDTRISTYWGIDRATISVVYNLCEL